MTCIVGLEYDGCVFIGGDIQGTGGNVKIVHTQPKVFNKRGVIFGYTTSYRFGQIIEHNLSDPVVPEDRNEIYRWLVTVLVPDVRKILKGHDFEGGGNCLIGVRDQLWELQGDFSVLRSVRGFASVGSGYEYALGSLHSMIAHQQPSSDQQAINLLKVAVHAAGTFSPTVGQNATVLSTTKGA